MSGSVKLRLDAESVLTDELPIKMYVVPTSTIDDVFVDVNIDKAATLEIIPLPNPYDTTFEGEASGALTISPNVSARGSYTKVVAPNTMVKLTKTESGTSSPITLSIRGIGTL